MAPFWWSNWHWPTVGDGIRTAETSNVVKDEPNQSIKTPISELSLLIVRQTGEECIIFTPHSITTEPISPRPCLPDTPDPPPSITMTPIESLLTSAPASSQARPERSQSQPIRLPAVARNYSNHTNKLFNPSVPRYVAGQTPRSLDHSMSIVVSKVLDSRKEHGGNHHHHHLHNLLEGVRRSLTQAVRQQHSTLLSRRSNSRRRIASPRSGEMIIGGPSDFRHMVHISERELQELRPDLERLYYKTDSADKRRSVVFKVNGQSFTRSKLLRLWQDQIIPTMQRRQGHEGQFSFKSFRPVDDRFTVKLIRLGIPHRLRPAVWRLLIGNALYVTEELFQIFRAHARSAANVLSSNLPSVISEQDEDEDEEEEEEEENGDDDEEQEDSDDDMSGANNDSANIEQSIGEASFSKSSQIGAAIEADSLEHDVLIDTPQSLTRSSTPSPLLPVTECNSPENHIKLSTTAQPVSCSFSSAEGIFSSPFASATSTSLSPLPPPPLPESPPNEIATTFAAVTIANDPNDENVNSTLQTNSSAWRRLSKSRSASTPVPFIIPGERKDDGRTETGAAEETVHGSNRRLSVVSAIGENTTISLARRPKKQPPTREILGHESSVALIPFDLPRTLAVDPDQIDPSSLASPPTLLQQHFTSKSSSIRYRQIVPNKSLAPPENKQGSCSSASNNDAKEQRRLEKMRAVLEAYVCFRPDVGYVQGMSCLASMLAGTGPQMTDFDMFACLSNLLHRPLFRTFYSMKPQAIRPYLRVHQSMLMTYLAPLAMHFQRLDLEPDMYLYEWVLTLFSQVLPLRLAYRVWDCCLLHGDYFVLRTALAILKFTAPMLEGQPFDVVATMLTRGADKIAPLIDEQQFFDTLFAIRFNQDQYDELLKRYEND